MKQATTLAELLPGQSAIVKTVGAGSKEVKRRLVDMGITPMTQITVKKVAPMGDPIEVNLRGYSLSLRKEDASKITLLTDEERQAFLKKEQALQADFEQRAGAVLSRHSSAQNDEHAHKQAAKLTEWVLNTQSQSCPAGGCAACGGCGGCLKKSLCSPAKQKGKGRPAEDVTPVKIALVGNPNAGKTTLFNAVTGAKEYVGNWPGVTVEKKERRLHAYGHEMTIVDLPGIYSLSTYSMEEIVARNFVLDEQPDAIINIIDATNLERNLYLTIQLMELERPMILALNMMDEVKAQGITIDVKRLALELGVPVVPICARTGQGVEELLQNCATLLSLAHEQVHHGFCIEPDDLYDSHTHAAHHRIGEIIGDAPQKAGLPMHWTEIKLLESDPLVLERLQLSQSQRSALQETLKNYAGTGVLDDNETRVADSRYRYITRVCGAAVKRLPAGTKTVSDRIDSVLTNKYLGIPIFLVLMGVIFMLTFDTIGGWLSDGVETLISGYTIPFVQTLLVNGGAADWLISLICDGILTGVGGVLTFLPQIALLFFFLSLLEDSGYMSRTAFLMDRALKRFGLSGKSFIPMLMGFGCTVPATMSARTMENEDDRRMTILLLPFMSCSAKLPVYGMIASAFFEQSRGLVVLSLYLLGIIVGILTGFLFRKTLFSSNHATFVMELPPYRIPSLKNTLLHVGERVQHFIEKAGSIILLMSIALWFLTRFDLHFAMTAQTEQSILGRFGTLIAPIFKPLGFGNWQASVALLSGLIAKEAVVSSLSLFLGVTGSAALSSALTTLFTPLAAYTFLVFILLYVPCLAAVTTMHRELHSGRYTLFMVIYQLLAAYTVALIVHIIGSLLL